MKTDSEKTIERELVRRVKTAGGIALKVVPFGMRGFPDRVVFLPERRVILVELKSTGKKLSAIQGYRFKLLKGLGLEVYKIDSMEQLNELKL